MTDRGGNPGAERPPSQRTLVIIPTFNELENLPLIVGRVHKACPEVHVLIVDDGSPDAPVSSPTNCPWPTPTGCT